MKVLNLQCSAQHAFEGWFASEDDFQQQLARRLVTCPFCSDSAITKMLSAPRLNLASKSNHTTHQPEVAPQDPRREVAQAAWMKAVRQLVASTEDVGDRFADEARRIHHGNAPERGIRGRASAADAQALREEGIDVVQMALPDFSKEPLQ